MKLNDFQLRLKLVRNNTLRSKKLTWKNRHCLRRSKYSQSYRQEEKKWKKEKKRKENKKANEDHYRYLCLSERRFVMQDSYELSIFEI